MNKIIPNTVYQEETNECGLACISMLAHTQGVTVSLDTLRERYPATDHGTSLLELSTILKDFGIATAPVLFEHDELKSIPLPAILHYGANHFVILAYRKGNNVCVINPAIGQQWLPYSALKLEISGYALILDPNNQSQSDEANTVGGKEQQTIQKRPLGIMSLKETSAISGIYWLMLLTFLVGLTLFIMPIMVSNAVNKAFSDIENADFPYGLFIVAFVLASLLALGVRAVTERFIKHFVLVNSGVGFSKLLSNSLHFFEKRAPGDVFSRFMAWQSAMAQKIELDNQLRTDWVIGIIALAIMFWIAPVLAAISSVGVTVMGLISVWAIIRDRWYTQQLQLKTASLNDFFMETLQGILTIKAGGLEEQRKIQFAWLSRDLFTCIQKRNVYEQVKGTLYQLTGSLEMVVFMLVILPMVASKMISLGDFFAYSFIRQIFTSYITRIFYSIIHKSQLHIIDTRANSLFPERIEPAVANFHAKSHLGGAPHLTFEHIDFSYDPAKQILKNVSLDLPTGAQIAIVGESGAGKSTLLRVIAGLIPYQHGLCHSDGDTIVYQQLAQLVCLQSQEDILFNTSVWENITLFAPNIQEKEQKIINKLLKSLVLDSVVNNLPGGINALIRESHSALSLGQRQRLLLARSMYSTRPILLLDEPTANLDEETAAKVIQAIQKHCHEMGKTLVVVTHSDKITSRFDVVYQIIDGELTKTIDNNRGQQEAQLNNPLLFAESVP
ncbi:MULTISPECIES: peptidase domain-containing ABC transporter [Providencia]|uniref:peptidase domain-containing ABC transporter n=1 Tax=Providencia TaxID=586 RepID=UPI001419AA93|nr:MULTISPECIES: cysteine peptidase family C39 domain-containing protein [Providencia]ELR5148520.1 ATP-binding cassette domain-containing protein [Providencia rettgeri]NIA45988.1 ATP-binding cassette domain-containing protein [Providencia rettgeri]NIA99506.1 ATP-binding cassette domain-containing protein [Providencia rettgeri]NIB17364.1 ATP-binding cassette domain-containing protein [Providencia rettgeri]NIB37389.1 ATP-binding cassette domain-containing protein [Providencia rettgeri]